MAETQTGYTIRSQNRFLPIIQAFNDNLYKNMQVQGELNDKILAFNKQREGEQFIGSYGEKLREAKTPEELNKILGEATQYAGQRGLTPHLSVIGALAQSQGNMIKAEQDKNKADLFVSTANNMEATAPWNGNPNVKIQDIVTDIKNKYSDPTMQADALEQVFKTLNRVETGISFNPKTGNYSIAQGIKSITGEEVSTGTPTKVGFDAGGRPFYDANEDKKLTEGEKYLGVTDTEKITQMQLQEEARKESERNRNAQYGAMTRKTIYNPDTNTYMEVLENNYSGKYYAINDKGDRGEQISGRGFVSGVDYRALTKTSASGVNTFRKEKNDVRNSINAQLQTLGYLDKGKFWGNYAKETISGSKYIDETTLNKLMGILSQKSANRPNDLNKYEKEIVNKGILNKWETEYWDKRKKYESSFDQFSQSYGEKPTLDDNEPIEPYMQNREIQKPNEPFIQKDEQSGIYKVYDKNGNLISSTFSKEKADSLYKGL